VRLSGADRQSVPQTWSGNTKCTIAEARAGPWHYICDSVRPAAATSWQSSVKHCGACPCSALNTSTASFNWTRWRTGSQCSCHRTGDMWSRRRAPVIRRAAAFWTAWSRCISPSAIPYMRLWRVDTNNWTAVFAASMNSVQLAATDVADGTLIDTKRDKYCWCSQTWWADYRRRRRGRAHSPLLSPSMTGPVCCWRWCSWLAVFRPTRRRLSSPDWDGGDWNSATLTRQQHSAKTDRRLLLLRGLERWRKPGSRQRTGVVCGHETRRLYLYLPCTN